MKIFTLNIFVFLLLLGSTISQAQRFNGGLRGGFVASEVSGDNLGGPNKPGWYASAFTFTPVSEIVSMKLEIMYITKGSRSIPNERNDFLEYTFHLQYVEVPVMAMINISRYSQSPILENIILHAGLSGSVVVGYREQMFGADIPASEVADFNPAELNIILGFAYPLAEKVNMHFNFSNSLTPIRPHSGGGRVWYNRGQYNSIWTLGLSYNFW
ncbi:MAG: outer membrane beta-barrel protein [Bacteroidales bacterium]